MNKWSIEKLQDLIENQTQESLNLEYKRAGALDKNKQDDITKDISSFANSDGGVLIYGVKEYDEKDKKHLPESIDAIDPSQFSRERLEQIINLIRPKIDGLIIESVVYKENKVIYIVDISSSSVAHQATDKRYYKRYNFIATPMEDYEIRDINNRNIHPRIDLKFEIKTTISEKRELIPSFSMSYLPKEKETYTKIRVFAENIGSVTANYISAKLHFPSEAIFEFGAKNGSIDMIKVMNKFRDVASMKNGYPQYHAARFEPLLPENSLFLDDVHISNELEKFKDKSLYWDLNADNAPTRRGEIQFSEIYYAIIDKTKKEI